MHLFALGFAAGIVALAGVTVGIMAWEDRAIERAVYDPRCPS